MFTNGNGSGPSYPTGSTTFTADTSTESYTFNATGKPTRRSLGPPAGPGQSWPEPGVDLSPAAS